MERDAYLEMAETEERHWWFVGRRRILDAIVEKELRGIANPEILEVGAGTGGNLGWLCRHGSVSAVEINDEAREIAIRKSGIQVAPGALPGRMPTLDKRFDLVVLLDVLEHIEDDVGALKSLEPLLGERGRILLTVPAYPWLWSGHDEFLHHKRRYTRKSLQKCITLAGLQAHRATHFNTLLFPAALVARAFQRMTKAEQPVGTSVPGRLTNCLLANVFGAERWALSNVGLPIGLSILAIAARAGRARS